MARWLVITFLWWCSLFGRAQQQVSFGDYSVPVQFHGKPAEPLHNTSNSKAFRTKIRQAVTKGPNFADHYILALWGCGTGCVMFSIVDAMDGRVYDSPFTISWVDEADEGVRYARNSRAIHIVGSLNEGNNSADRWYVWDGRELKLQFEKPAQHLASQR
jgi:hypothetical protein